MSEVQQNFKRVEVKFLITPEQQQAVLRGIESHMREDRYGRSEIMNIYYDTPDYALIRRSLEKPVYKEKLRVRSYGTPGEQGKVFVEIKKKYKGIVYKRREVMTPGAAEMFLRNRESRNPDAMSEKPETEFFPDEEIGRNAVSAGRIDPGVSAGRIDSVVSAGRIDSGVSAGRIDSVVSAGRIDPGVSAGRVSSIVSVRQISSEMSSSSLSQIGKEILAFQNFHRTEPKVFISYDRIAFAGIEEPGLRITFDTNMRWRETELDLRAGNFGESFQPSGRILMEVKIPGAAPLWLCRLFSENGIFRTSFSKYGTCYTEKIAAARKIYSLPEVSAVHIMKKNIA